MTIITNFLMLLASFIIIPIIFFMIYFVAKIINTVTGFIVNGVETLYYELQNKEIKHYKYKSIRRM